MKSLAQTAAERWEVGSWPFQWIGLPSPPWAEWPKPAVWFALGRHALAALLATLKGPSRRLWLPDYFCEETVEHWARYLPVVRYQDNPGWAKPNWESLLPAPQDVVLCMNYFGVREGTVWQHWRRDHICILVEDHTHDPCSPWALSSGADYAFSSLRKTMPVPDGAILWSPTGSPLPEQPRDGDWQGCAMKLLSAMMKAEYLLGHPCQDLKPRFRELELNGEELMSRAPLSAMSPYSRAYLMAGLPKAWCDQRRENVQYLLSALKGWENAKPLFTTWPVGATPYALVLVLPSANRRDHYRALLQRANIYCPLLWPSPPTARELNRDLAARSLVIPADQRYDVQDMARIQAVLVQDQ
jgi:hypothetical protein